MDIHEKGFDEHGGDEAAMQQAIGEALAELISANSPALTLLSFIGCSLDAEALGLVFDALRLNRHLSALYCWKDRRNLSSHFARASRVLPAVRACSSLQTLEWDGSAYRGDVAWDEAKEILRGRRETAVVAVVAPQVQGAGASSSDGVVF